MKNFSTFVLLLTFISVLANPAWAANPPDVTGSVTTQQDLTSAGTFNVTSTGTVNVSSGAVAILLDKASVTQTVNNSGVINESGTTTSSGYAFNDNQKSATLFINNNTGAIIETANADVFHMTKGSSVLTITNSGTIVSLNSSLGGNQAINLAGINGSGSSTIINNVGGLILANGADAIRPGLNGVITNSGTILAIAVSGSGSDAIEAAAQSGNTGNSGVVITNTSTGLISGGRHGITGGNTDTSTGGSFTMSISNTAGGVIQGNNGAGVNIDGFNANEVVTITNAGLISGKGAMLNGTNTAQDGDGVDVDGIVNITNSGTIISINSINDTSEGVTVGGGTIKNSGTIEGSVITPVGTNTAVGRGITFAGVDKDSVGNPIPIQKIYTTTVVTNSGLIKGDTDSGIAILGITGTTNYSVTITNTLGGRIEGGGSVAVIDGSALANGEGTASANDETVINYGTIQAFGSGKAISLGSGNNSVQIIGGTASVIGDMSGGLTGTNTATLTIDPTTGQTFAYGGVISNFSSVAILSGTVNFSAANSIISTTTLSTTSGSILNLGGGTATVNSLTNLGLINNGTVTISGTGTVSGLSGSMHFTKSSLGTTTVTGTNTNTGGTTVTQGKLAVDGSLSGSVSVTSGGEVGGHGLIGGTISGSGLVGPGNSPGILTASSVDPSGGMTFAFELTQVGAPTWSNAAASGNDVLHLTGGTPFTSALTSGNTIDLYFSGLNLTYDGGFFVDGTTDTLTANLTNATFKYFVVDNTNGTLVYNGNKYVEVAGTAGTIQITGANFGTGTVNGWTEQFTVSVPEPSTYVLLGLGALGLIILARRHGNRIG